MKPELMALTALNKTDKQIKDLLTTAMADEADAGNVKTRKMLEGKIVAYTAALRIIESVKEEFR